MQLNMMRGDYKLIPIRLTKNGANYQVGEEENIIFTLKRYSSDGDYIFQKQLSNGITWDAEKERYIIEITNKDTKDIYLDTNSFDFQFDVVFILEGNKPLTTRGTLTIERDITTNEYIPSEYEGLTPEQIEAIEEISINLDDELTISFDETVLNIDFSIDGKNLVVNNNMDGVDFNLKNGNLEVEY